MLEMIFANGDYPEYYYNENNNKNNNNNNDEIKKQHNYRVDVEEYVVDYKIGIEDDSDIGYGYYVDLDINTPPKLNYSKKSSVLNLPPKNYMMNKPIKYLPPIAEEEIFYKKNNNPDFKLGVSAKTTQTIFTGITFCATVAFYYFCKTHAK